MAKALVTQEMVSQAAEVLLADGKEASIIAVKEKIGDVGSYSTIKKFLDSWKEQRQAQPAPIEVPATIIERSALLAREIWQAAVTLADQQIAEIREKTQHQVDEAKKAQQEAEQVVERLEATLDDAQRQLANERKTTAAQQGEIAHLREAAASAQTQITMQEQLIAELRTQVQQQREQTTTEQLAVEVQAMQQQLRQLLAQKKPSTKANAKTGGK